MATTRHFVFPGDMLFHEGQAAKHMFFLTVGMMAYSRQNVQNLSDVSPFIRPAMTARLSRDSANSNSGVPDVTLAPGSWICEAVLWVDWTHVGSLYSASECDIVMVDADAFQVALKNNTASLREANTYAKGFLAGLNRSDRANDMFMSDLLEGLWFRLLTEFHVHRRGAGTNRRTSSAVRSLVAHTTDVRDRIVEALCGCCCRMLARRTPRDDDED